MATLAYPAFRDDGFGPRPMSQSRSRRQSIVGYGGQQPLGFSYNDHAGIYTEPQMSVGLHDEVGGMVISFANSSDINLLVDLSPTWVSNIRPTRQTKPAHAG